MREKEKGRIERHEIETKRDVTSECHNRSQITDHRRKRK